MQIHLILVGVPLALVALLSLMIWSRKGPRPANYNLSERWTHPPILWAATDEAVGDTHGHGEGQFTVGGGASGTW